MGQRPCPLSSVHSLLVSRSEHYELFNDARHGSVSQKKATLWMHSQTRKKKLLYILSQRSASVHRYEGAACKFCVNAFEAGRLHGMPYTIKIYIFILRPVLLSSFLSIAAISPNFHSSACRVDWATTANALCNRTNASCAPQPYDQRDIYDYVPTASHFPVNRGEWRGTTKKRQKRNSRIV